MSMQYKAFCPSCDCRLSWLAFPFRNCPSCGATIHSTASVFWVLLPLAGWISIVPAGCVGFEAVSSEAVQAYAPMSHFMQWLVVTLVAAVPVLGSLALTLVLWPYIASYKVEIG